MHPCVQRKREREKEIEQIDCVFKKIIFGQDGIQRETNRKRLLISQNKLRVAAGRGGRDRVAGLWTLGRICDMVSAVKCVSLTIHRLVPLGQIIHYMSIK